MGGGKKAGGPPRQPADEIKKNMAERRGSLKKRRDRRGARDRWVGLVEITLPNIKPRPSKNRMGKKQKGCRAGTEKTRSENGCRLRMIELPMREGDKRRKKVRKRGDQISVFVLDNRGRTGRGEANDVQSRP